MLSKIKLYCTITLLCLLTSCSQVQPPRSERDFYIKKRQYSITAANYLKQASKEYSPKKEELNLKAAKYFFLAEETSKTKEILSSITPMTVDQKALYHIIQAEIMLLEQQSIEAKRILNNILSIQDLSTEMQQEFYQTRIKINLKIGNTVQVVKDHINLESFLQNYEDEKNNSKKILNTLSQLTPSALKAIQSQHQEYNLNGWLEFVYIIKQYDSNSSQLARAMELWKRQYPLHTAYQFLPDTKTTITIASEEPEKIKKIALLLPLSETHAKSARIIRDGILAAHYQHAKNNSQTIEIKIYDTMAIGSVIKAYQTAIKDKNNFIIGPLTKGNIEKLATLYKLEIPVLALNTISINNTINKNLFLFGLPPETEATTIAEKAWHDGYRKALIIAPNNELGDRITKSFTTTWNKLNAKVLACERYNIHADLNLKIRKLLDIEASETRANNLQRLGIKINYVLRRRQDVDMIFMVANPTIARQIKPLLNFYYAGNIPVYANSSIYSGKQSATQDQDLNGIQFCDMPWTLDQAIISKTIYKTITKLWPENIDQYIRLYALGIDAYKIALQLPQLTLFPDLGISGMTGMLTIDNQNKIQHKLMWATFKNGIPILHATEQN